MKNQINVFISVTFMFSFAQCYNILAIFNVPSKSHHILGHKLGEGLIKRGHHVTLVSPFTIEPAENYTHIHLKSILEYKNREQTTSLLSTTKSLLSTMSTIVSFMRDIDILFWEDPSIQRIIREKPKYDLVILGYFANDVALGLAHHLGVPTIYFNGIGSSIHGNAYVANPNMVYVPHPLYSTPTDGFFSRLITVTVNCLMYAMNYFYADPFHQGLLTKHFPNAPPLEELKKNLSLILLNSHFSIEPPRPHVPNMIQIGGFHIQDSKELPTDIKNYLDSATEGAILFSFGSNVLISSIDKSKLQAIFKVLSEMSPMKVLFKSEIDHDNIPKNIMVRKWLPQTDVLGHPNIKVFISHGGLGGTTESVYHGVPILGIPFFGDQVMNLVDAQAAGYAVQIEIKDFTENLFRNTLKEVIENPKYRENAKKRSSLLKEQPVKPMDNAVFWIEHIIKYGGGSHLKNAGVDLTWYQLYMVDIYLFYIITLCLVIIFNYYVIKITVRIISRLYCKTFSKVKQS